MMNQPYLRRAAIPDTLHVPGMMLDLETRMDGGASLPWCFGWQIGESPVQFAIVDRYFEGGTLTLSDGTTLTMVEDSDTGWRMMAEAAQSVAGAVYHWGAFEMGILRSTAPPDAREVLEGRLHDLNRTFRRTFMLPFKGTGLKKVGPYLGYRWPEGTSAFTAWADYNAWLLESNKDALARACAYNRADVEALALIWRWMIEHSETSE
jgi:hypothetical protein